MTLDWDGKIRMDCSSPYATARLIALKDRFDISFAWVCVVGVYVIVLNLRGPSASLQSSTESSMPPPT